MQLYNASSLMLFYMLLGSLVFFTTGPPNMTVLLSSGISCLVIYPESEHESHSFVRLFATPWTVQSLEFSRPRILEWVAFSFSRDLSNPGIKPRSPGLQADSLPTREAQEYWSE